MIPVDPARIAFSVAGGLAVLYVGILLLVFLLQSRMVFFPSKELIATPSDVGLVFEEISLVSDDGVLIHGWFVPGDGSALCLLYFHGNAGNISHRLETLNLFHRLGLSVLIIDYRGYGKSGGSPDERGTYLDADAAWKYLVNERGMSPEQIVVLGRSLGGAIAVRLATIATPRALIVESTFTSIPDRGAELYPFLPVRLLSRIQYNSLERIGRVRCPLLVVHSSDDEIVPVHHGERLFAAAKEPKEFLHITGGHNDGFLVPSSRYAEGLSRFLEGLRR